MTMTMITPAESPQAATDWAVGGASIITKHTSCVGSTDNGENERRQQRPSISLSVITATTANTKNTSLSGISAGDDDDSFHSADADDTDTDTNIDLTTATMTTKMDKDTPHGPTKVDDDDSFHSTADTCTDANPHDAATSTKLMIKSKDVKSPVATAPDASPPPEGATTLKFCGQAAYWTPAEEERLAIAVKTCGEENGDAIAAMMPNRSRASCRTKWTKLAGRSCSDRLPWTDEQEKRLIHVVNTCVVGDWVTVGTLVSGRSAVACREKWKRMMGKWSAAEDQELVLAVKACGEGNWKKIADMVPKRTIRQCRFRWTTTKPDASRDPVSRVFGTDEAETTLTQEAKTCDAGDSDGVGETCSTQPRTDREETKLIHAVNTCDSAVDTVPGLTEVACSEQPWTNEEIKRLVDGVKTHGEWGKWAAIAAGIPNHSQAECRLKWMSTTPEWTPQEDVLLAVAVEACGKGPWLQVAARVPGRTVSSVELFT
jgi:hypothetical protein